MFEFVFFFEAFKLQQIKIKFLYLNLNVLLCQYVDDLARLKLSKERLLKSSQIYFFVLLQRPETRLLLCWHCCYRGQYPAPQQLYSSKSIWRQCKTNACYQLQATAAAVSGAVFIIRTPAPTHSAQWRSSTCQCLLRGFGHFHLQSKIFLLNQMLPFMCPLMSKPFFCSKCVNFHRWPADDSMLASDKVKEFMFTVPVIMIRLQRPAGR